MINRFRITRLIVALLALAVLGASIEAKLSWYQATHTGNATTLQVIKLREIRLGQVTAAAEAPPVTITNVIEPEPDRSVPAIPPRINPGSGPSIEQCHWFRPPPAVC